MDKNLGRASLIGGLLCWASFPLLGFGNIDASPMLAALLFFAPMACLLAALLAACLGVVALILKRQVIAARFGLGLSILYLGLMLYAAISLDD